MTQQNPESPRPVKHLSLSIGGMHCANCVGRVEYNLLRVPGVRRVTVNLVQERADIDYDTGTPLDFIGAVTRAGYKAAVWRGIGAQLRSDRISRIRLAVCLILSLPLLLEMAGHLVGLPFKLPSIIAVVLASIVQFWGGWPFYVGFWRAMRNRVTNMDVLVVIGSTIAYTTSLWRVVHNAGPHLFESSALIITFVLFGRWLEAALRRKALSAVHELVRLQPQQVRRVAAGRETMVPLSEISVGDIIAVWTGERVPLDGEISEGLATFDYSMINGETSPRVLGIGEPVASVLAGALCLNGSIRLKVTNHAGQTMIDRIADMVSLAQASRSPAQRLADQAAALFINTVLVVAALTFVFWGAHGDLETAQQAGLAVLLMACPCALGLAVPMAIAVAIGQGARHGLLIRDAAALERAALVTTVIFDKTGTLSTGYPELAEKVTYGSHSSDEILAYAAALNRKVNHPIAAALREIVAARQLPLALPVLQSDATIVFGRGVRGTLQDGTQILCGNLQFMLENNIPLEDAAATAAGWEERGRTLSWVATLTPRPRLLGLMSFRDNLRPEAAEAVTGLAHRQYNLAIISGDNKHTALSIAKRVGIGNVMGEAFPQDKLQEIQKRQKWGEVVAMVGDGMNDAPALAMADLGIATHGGVDAADAAAPVRLLRDDLRLVPALFSLAAATRRVMFMNIFWAVAFNLIALPLAAAGAIPVYLAVFSMSISSLIVILQAMSLKLWRPPYA